MVTALMAVAGLVFLFWYGIYTAEKYRKLYGDTPKPTDIGALTKSLKSVDYGARDDYRNFGTTMSISACTSIAFASCVTSVVNIPQYVIRR